ncbi:hypothetical protein [Isoptericola sp. b408]|nr:hypothetical protein [Isoptericola sp. b408]MDO8150274.1 hypothetical protein [Isoptericola sp. b408]
MTLKRLAVVGSLTALMALLLYLISTKNPLGGWIVSLTLPGIVVYGLVRRRVSGKSTSASVRPAAQGMNEVQDVVLNRPGVSVTYGSPEGTVATEYDPRIVDFLDDPGHHDDSPAN